MLTTGAATGILTNEVNIGFTPEGKYLTAGNDVVDLSNWNGSGSVNIGDAFSNDNDKVTVMADKLDGAVANDKLKLTSIENLEIINSGATDPVILKGANFKGLEAIKLIGDATTLNVSEFTHGVKIDATANADSIIGSSKADTINGGAGNDTIVGNDGVDVLTGGNGADTFVVGSIKAAGVDQILDFSAEDKIALKGFVPNELKKFDASTFSTVTYKTLDSVLATFATGGANATKTGDVVVFNYDGATYALLSKGEGFREGTDSLVDITGTNVASLTESNFGTSGNFGNYADFKAAVDAGKVDSPTTIKSITANDAAALLTTDKTYLDKIEAGGIGAVTGAPVNVAMNATTFDASKFAEKLAASVILNITGTADNDTITSPLAGIINAGDGNDTIDASTATDAVTIDGGAGNNTITGGAGHDRITTNGAGTNSITAGAGNDIITLGSAGKDTVVFAATAAANGVDTITGFEAGNDKDLLKVSTFTTGTVTGNVDIKDTGKGDVSTKKVLVDTKADVVADAAAAKGLFSTTDDGSNKYKVQDGQKLFFIDSDGISAKTGDKMFYVEVAGTEITVTQVGVLGATTTSAAWDASNFA